MEVPLMGIHLPETWSLKCMVASGMVVVSVILMVNR